MAPFQLRSCFHPSERLSLEPANKIGLARCKVSYHPFCHNRAETAMNRGLRAYSRQAPHRCRSNSAACARRAKALFCQRRTAEQLLPAGLHSHVIPDSMDHFSHPAFMPPRCAPAINGRTTRKCSRETRMRRLSLKGVAAVVNAAPAPQGHATKSVIETSACARADVAAATVSRTNWRGRGGFRARPCGPPPARVAGRRLPPHGAPDRVLAARLPVTRAPE